MQVYVQERQANGTTRRLPASDVMQALGAQAANLKSQLCVANILPKAAMTREQLKNYLAMPPSGNARFCVFIEFLFKYKIYNDVFFSFHSGIDPLIWQQAILDNPNPDKYLPVPMVGFTELYKRLKQQESQTKLHQTKLNVRIDSILS